MKTVTMSILLFVVGISMLTAQQTSTMSIAPSQFNSWLAKADGEKVSIDINLPGLGMRTARLERFRVTDAGTKVQLVTEDGIVDGRLPLSVHLQGKVDGFPQSHVVLSVFEGWALGRVVLDATAQNVYSISPRSSSPYSELVVVNERALEEPAPWHCALDEDIPIDQGDKKGEGTQATLLRHVKLAIECDRDYYLDFGSNATTATQYAEAVLAHSSSIYQRDANATLYIGSFLLWTTADPYTGTNASTLLTQFRDYWRVNRTNVDRDVAQLMSGVNGIGGVAYLNTLCSNSNGYCVAGTNNNITYPRTTYAWDTDVTSHELGHNIGSPHTHSCSWSPPIDSCYAAEGSCYTGTKAVLGTIMSYCHLTAQGTELRFHTRVADFLKDKLANWNCVEASLELTLNAGNDVSICSGSSATLSASYTDGTAPVSITWTPSAGMTNPTTLTPTVTPTSTTSYAIEVRDAYNVVRRDTVVVIVNPNITVDVPNSYAYCNNGPLTVTATVTGGTAPVVYRWKGWNIDVTTTTPTVTVSPTAPTWLVLTATDSKGCTAKDSMDIVVFEKPEMSLAAIDTVACTGSQLTLTTSTEKGRPPYTYSWYANGVLLSTPNAVLTHTIDTATFFRVIVRDINQCTDTAEMFVNVTNQNFTLNPKTVTVPSLPACEQEFEMWLTARNTGKDVIRITHIKARRIQSSSRDIPFTLNPGQSHQFPVISKMPPGDVSDTVDVMSEQCGRIQSTVVTGTRDHIYAHPTSEPSLAVPVLYCAGAQTRTVTIDVVNQTKFDAHINKITSRWFKSSVVSFAPQALLRGDTTSVEATIVVNTPPGAILDTFDVEFRSLGCTGTIMAPVRFESTNGAMTMVNRIDFGVVGSDQQTPVSRDLVITPNVAPLESVVVTKVTVTGPFTTSLTAPSVLINNIPQTEKIYFDPQSITQSGVVRGEIAYEIDSCGAPYKVALEVTQSVVGVDEPSPNVNGPSIIHNATGTISVRGTSGTLSISDVRGAQILGRSIEDGNSIDVSMLAQGVYVVLVTDANGKTVHAVLSLP